MPALYAKLTGDATLMGMLGAGSASVKGQGEFEAETDLPAIVCEYATGRQMNGHTAYFEDWFVFVVDRDHGYYRVAGILERIKNLLDGSTLDLSAAGLPSTNARCFGIEWINDLANQPSRVFRAETGGSLFRIYLS